MYSYKSTIFEKIKDRILAVYVDEVHFHFSSFSEKPDSAIRQSLYILVMNEPYKRIRIPRHARKNIVKMKEIARSELHK